ncbi:MAG: hypothetical protein U5Q03_15035 [Bacteroidota bacterium]|nr:hypothetical protein [Bacteroidota bacterium]
MKKCILFLLFFISAIAMVSGQTAGSKFERISLGENHYTNSGIAVSPDGKYAAVSGTKHYPFFIYDWQNNTIVKEFNVGNWFAGSSVDYSQNGSYILLQQLHYVDFAPNKDRETNFEIIDANSGRTVKRFGDHHSVKISADESKAIALSGDVISIWDLPAGKKAGSFTVPEAANSISISPDGRHIAVSHRVSDNMAKQYPRLKNDRKARKHTTKYKQMISVYDAESYEKLFTIDSFFDIIYRLEYIQEGKGMLCLRPASSQRE